MIDSGLVGRGTARAEDAQGTPTQSHISPSILVYEDKPRPVSHDAHGADAEVAAVRKEVLLRPPERKLMLMQTERTPDHSHKPRPI